MNKDQEKYIFNLVEKEMRRLDLIKYNYSPRYHSKKLKEIHKPLSLNISILKYLELKYLKKEVYVFQF